MRTFSKLALLIFSAMAVFGCARDYYNIPHETMEKKVKVIGVAPFFVDPDSDIRHPEKEAIVRLIRDVNRKQEKELIARLRETGNFYSVRQIDDEPTKLFSTLLQSREKRDDAGIVYNKYFYKKPELKEIVSANGLDALLLVTVNGLTNKGKMYSSNLLSYLETDFNYLAVSAELLDAEGTLLWEYPNFRQHTLNYPMLFAMQYPDFDEAAANLSDQVEVKFKTVAGITAAFAKSEPSAVANGSKISTLYAAQLEEMVSLMKTRKPLFGGKAAPGAATPAAAGATPMTAAPAVPAAPAASGIAPAPAPRPAPALPAPAVAPAPQPAAAPVVVPTPSAPNLSPSGNSVPVSSEQIVGDPPMAPPVPLPAK